MDVWGGWFAARGIADDASPVAAFEGQLRDAALVEAAETQRDHFVILGLRGVVERQGSGPRSSATPAAMPLSFAACSAENQQSCSRATMSAASVSSTRELAPVWLKTSRIMFKS
jgi:hypothetical protein